MNEKKKRCKNCYRLLDANTKYFRVRRVVGERVYLNATCKMCESNRRHSQDIWKRKAQRTIVYHRLRALEEYQTSPEKFPSWDGRYERWAATYGWDDYDKIAREMEATFDGVCKICGKPYKGDPSKGIEPMGHGRADMTVDIIDRTLEPFYADNTRLACLTCNSSKGLKTPDEERQRKKDYQIWSETSPDIYQLSFSLIVELPTVLSDEPMKGKAVAAEGKPAIYEAGEQLKFDIDSL